MKNYQKHVYKNIEYKRNLPYSCQFCSYIGYKQNRFQKHLQCTPTCEYFYNKKPVTTGEILDLSSGQGSKNTSVPNQTSHQYKRVAVSGIVDTIQLTINDNTSSNMDF